MNKKSCLNCVSYPEYQITRCKYDNWPCKNHNRWQRNPRKWLSILPEEPGWYWWRRKQGNKGTVVQVYINPFNNTELFFGNKTKTASLVKQYPKSEWQGPITPEN
jgi:hypothetical protein